VSGVTVVGVRGHLVAVEAVLHSLMGIEFLGWRPDPNFRLERREAGANASRWRLSAASLADP
jgi:hypothetical protein